jgi:hypothetical protein
MKFKSFNRIYVEELNTEIVIDYFPTQESYNKSRRARLLYIHFNFLNARPVFNKTFTRTVYVKEIQIKIFQNEKGNNLQTIYINIDQEI